MLTKNALQYCLLLFFTLLTASLYSVNKPFPQSEKFDHCIRPDIAAGTFAATIATRFNIVR